LYLFSLRVRIIDVTIFAIIILAISVTAASTIKVVYAELQQQQNKVITILPGASGKNNPEFFDVTFYPIHVGDKLQWYNADDVNHKITIWSDDE
jgi:plastocyanin